MSNYMIEMNGISKCFGTVQANNDISLKVECGKIRAIVGENGAGKSTLMKILNGLYQPDSGTISLRGECVTLKSPREAVAQGIGMVYQHFMLVPTLSVTENMILGVEPNTLGFIDYHTARQKVIDVSETYGMKIDPDAHISSLSVGMQQRVEILKILFKGAELLVFDEPTAVLTPQEVKEFYKIMRSLKDEGKTIIFITHKLHEVLEVSDAITVIRKGAVAGELKTADATREILAQLMVGRPVLFETKRVEKEMGELYVQIANLMVCNDWGKNVVKEIDLSIHRGEILGIAGVDGNGQSELIEALAGLRTIQSGEYLVAGKRFNGKSVHYLRKSGVSHIPEDRHKRGAVSSYSVSENLAFGVHRSLFIKNRIFLDYKAMRRNARTQIERYDIRPQNPDLNFGNLSGGNQQKVVVARELDMKHDFLICAQPTRGVDIGAIESIHSMIIDEKLKGKAILLVSAELSEIMNLADTIAVMFEGEISGVLKRSEATEEKIGVLMMGGHLE